MTVRFIFFRKNRIARQKVEHVLKIYVIFIYKKFNEFFELRGR